mgnify:CR=1 FL=1
MTSEELKAALLNGRAIVFRAPSSGGSELEYRCVSAVIYRADGKGGIKVTAEIEDRNGRSAVIADPARIRYKEDLRKEVER